MIVFDSLTKRYGEVAAVDRLTLQVGRGEVYALLGANGAGKTTALRCLATLLVPSSGSTAVDGYDSSAAPLEVRRRLGFLSASMGLYARLTPREVLEYFGALQGMAQAALSSRVEELLSRFEIDAFADRLCGTLSTGQRQRVSIARAIVHDPPALVLDEPTLGLDVLSGETIHTFVAESRERGRAVLFSTHTMSEVELLADRVGIIAGGRLVAEGSIAEILAQGDDVSLSRAFLKIVRGTA
ncbi:MAG: ATP-binding cassette domain-containing protein [Gemmatimonadota bacterium]